MSQYSLEIKNKVNLKNFPIQSDSKPFVSISCISFNQADYIGNVLEGFLNQNVNFPVEILIHDDASTDGTREIIEAYSNEYPNIIKPILQTENQFSKGAKCIHATYNFYRSKGKYIATCEGDDYWIDNNKLIKQVQFLENNKDFSLCSHEAYFTSINYNRSFKGMSSILYRNLKYNGYSHFSKITKLLLNNNPNFWNKRRQKGIKPEVADLEYLLDTYHKHIYIPTVSILGHGNIFRNIPKELLMTPSGHKEHIFWAALHGKVKHFRDVMGQRNQQPNSLTITKAHIKNKTIAKRINHFEKFYTTLSKFANENQKKQIKLALAKLKAYYA